MSDSSVKYVLPTIGANEMSKDDQGALIVNQATATIVAAHLAYAGQAAAIASTAGLGPAAPYLITPTELPGLIDGVQTALRQF